ncbi:quinone oxidoreductase family protein [Gryllotalpicola protaetiae]|uniref:NADP-dependent oxidoreductase n=1 Tax=Gryllotalpicola protaetiae TaxID=2419771 RepID=A0A387BFN3_9MICO|nr:NADP-dependent oxidoreductase [Gryllotalpicola protaetiae]AYG02733.1 NADP-dependent oxidoreductase [Gryllotalpicola protaetiae]
MSFPALAEAVLITRAGGPEVLEVREVPVVAPGPGEVLVRVRAAGVNPVDTKIRKGTRGEITEPKRLGSDAAGEVVAVGDGASFEVGDEVIGWGQPGTYAEYVTGPAAKWTPKPPAVSFAQGAALGVPASTAYQCLKSAGLAPGETLLVHAGAGAVGQAAIQYARLWGANVVATASETNHDRLRALGAVPVTYGDGLLDRVRAVAPQGIDQVLEAAGTLDAIGASLALVADRARIVEIVVPGWAAEYGVTVFSGGLPGSMTPEANALRDEAIPYTAGLFADGRFAVELAESFALADAPRAHELIETGHPGGKIVLIP